MRMILADVLTISANLAGICGLSIPCGFDAEGLPIGLQLLGAPFTEERPAAAGAGVSERYDWHMRSPDLAGMILCHRGTGAKTYRGYGS